VPSSSTTARVSSAASRSSRNLLLPGLVLFAVLLLGFAAFAGGGADETAGDDAAGDPAAEADPNTDGGETATADDGEFDLRAVERRIEGDPYAVGEVDAPVVMVEYSDFQCPFCGVFARDTHPQLMERYVADGTLRIEYRDTPILGEESTTAALGGRAAANQGAFWEFHDEVFSEDRERNAGELAADRLVEMAADLGLDVERFAQDLEDPAAMEAVQRDRREAQELGVSSTPAFLINGRPILGAQPLDTFVAVIEEAAAAAGSDAASAGDA
jgi:protein-disulfide isomerase